MQGLEMAEHRERSAPWAESLHSTAGADPGLSWHHLLPGAGGCGHSGWCSPEKGVGWLLQDPVCPSLPTATHAHGQGSELCWGQERTGRAQARDTDCASHPIRFPGQVAVPDDGNTLDNSQPGDRGDRVCSCRLRGHGLGTRAATLPVLQRHEVEVRNLHGWPDLGREEEER